jgi:hypothetical protein
MRPLIASDAQVGTMTTARRPFGTITGTVSSPRTVELVLKFFF